MDTVFFTFGPGYEKPVWYGEDEYPDRPPPPDGPPPGIPPPPDSPPDFIANYDQPRTIHFVCVGIIIPLGLAFNILTMVVFLKSRTLRKTTTGHYLVALAVADSLFLVGEFFRWLNTPSLEHLGWTIDFLDHIDALCKIVMWLRYSSKLASAWITVIITVERFITVAFPLKVMTISTPRIAKITICAVFILSYAGGAFPFWTVGVYVHEGVSMCIVIPEKYDTYDICSWVYLRVGTLILPGVIIIVFCVMIMCILKKAKRVRHRQLSVTSSTSSSSGRTPTHKIERQLTVMLVAVAVAFVLLRLPYTITYYLHFYIEEIFGPEVPAETDYALLYTLKMTDVFATINYASNFFLYCVCGSTFRKQLKRLFGKQQGGFRSRTSNSGSSYAYNRSISTQHEYNRQLSNGSQCKNNRSQPQTKC